LIEKSVLFAGGIENFIIVKRLFVVCGWVIDSNKVQGVCNSCKQEQDAEIEAKESRHVKYCLLDKLNVQHIVLEQSQPEDESAPYKNKIQDDELEHLAVVQKRCVSIDEDGDVDSVCGPVNNVPWTDVVPSELPHLSDLLPYEV
jgi:hypothetical protein